MWSGGSLRVLDLPCDSRPLLEGPQVSGASSLWASGGRAGPSVCGSCSGLGSCSVLRLLPSVLREEQGRSGGGSQPSGAGGMGGWSAPAEAPGQLPVDGALGGKLTKGAGMLC